MARVQKKQSAGSAAKEDNREEKKERRKRDRELIGWSRSYWLQAPLIFVMAIIPLIVYYCVFDTRLSEFWWFGGSDMQADFYVYAKMFLFLAASGYMLLVLMFQHFFGGHKLTWDKIFIPLLVYAGLIILSTFFSISKYHSLRGSYQQFEPMWALLGYCITAYYAFYLLRSEQAIRRLLGWFAVGVALMSVLGMSQVAGHDLLQTDLGKTIITPSGYDISLLSWSIEKGRAYLSLENPNYVGSYVVLIVPLLAGMVFATTKLWKRIVYAVLLIIMMVILFSSSSRTGIFALVVSFLVMLLFLRRELITHWKVSICAIIALAAVFIGYNTYSHNYLFERIKSVTNIVEDKTPVQIETKEDHVAIEYEGNQLIVRDVTDADGNRTIQMSDGEGNGIACPDPNPDDGWCYLEDERFPFSVRLWNDENFQGINMMICGYSWVFADLTGQENASGYYHYSNGRFVKLFREQEYKDFFAEHQRFASGRGFIWSRTFSVMRKYFLLGSGPDTFIQVFPHDEVVGMTYAGYQNMLMTKPHSFFLQIGAQTGVPSLIAVIAFIGIYIVDTFRTFWRKKNESGMYWIGIASVSAVVGFLVSGLANDSLMGITPVFYVILGLGIRINHMEREQTVR